MSFKNFSELFLKQRIISKAALNYFQEKENSKSFSSNLSHKRKIPITSLNLFSRPFIFQDLPWAQKTASARPKTLKNGNYQDHDNRYGHHFISIFCDGSKNI